MLISTRGRYALRILIDMAEHQGDDFVPLKDIAKRQEISEKYLESIVRILVRGNIVTGVRGKGGGYRLILPPDQYTVGQILRLTEGTLSPVSCLDKGTTPCPNFPGCRTFPMWQGLEHLIDEYLETYTIADLMNPEDPGNYYVI